MALDQHTFDTNPRDYAMELADNMDSDRLLVACLKWMSHDQVRSMLDANELSPRFDNDNEEE